ncbi:MAG: 50S ribosomal protein L22 [Clostridiales bacterium]|nr:50S ribosomal protein L22 [Clostridiales bacterium]
MEAKAVAKYIRVSPRKARLVVDLIRGKSVDEAEAILRFTPNRAAGATGKVLKSATANAENNLHLNHDELTVMAAYVDEGPSLKRFKPRAQGRADRMVHRMSHITVVVGTREEV